MRHPEKASVNTGAGDVCRRGSCIMAGVRGVCVRARVRVQVRVRVCVGGEGGHCRWEDIE